MDDGNSVSVIGRHHLHRPGYGEGRGGEGGEARSAARASCIGPCSGPTHRAAGQGREGTSTLALVNVVQQLPAPGTLRESPAMRPAALPPPPSPPPQPPIERWEGPGPRSVRSSFPVCMFSVEDTPAGGMQCTPHDQRACSPGRIDRCPGLPSLSPDDHSARRGERTWYGRTRAGIPSLMVWVWVKRR